MARTVVKKLKTKTIYKVVEGYEKEFKRGFAKEVGELSTNFIQSLTKLLMNHDQSDNTDAA